MCQTEREIVEISCLAQYQMENAAQNMAKGKISLMAHTNYVTKNRFD